MYSSRIPAQHLKPSLEVEIKSFHSILSEVCPLLKIFSDIAHC